MKKKRKRRIKKIVFLPLMLLILIGSAWFLYPKNNKPLLEGYLGSSTPQVSLCDASYQVVKEVYRGEKVSYREEKDHLGYYVVKYDKKDYYVKKENLVASKDEVVFEDTLYVRTSASVYQDSDSSHLIGLVKKGEMVTITGYDSLEEGIVNKYQIDYQGKSGYVRSKYLVTTKELADLPYDMDGSYQVHLKRGNTWGGGDGGSLDFYPVEKPAFENNVMPDEVRSLYINTATVPHIDEYITFAKDNHINAFVVDIKDNTSPGYASLVMKEQSATNYLKANNTFEDYQKTIQKLKENGFYVIGRITTFKDSYYVQDHPDSAIVSTQDGQPYLHNGSYWPSAYRRDVWEFAVELAKEAVTEMGFHEIQFDYVRFPDRTYQLEKNGSIDLKNVYGETKAQAIQTFLMYACDELHELGVYVSADVFGESAHNYVTGYGQYWGAISNVVDVISAMPYPDHFGAYEYGFQQVVWTIPYQVLYTWGSEFAMKRQEEIPTPAKVRTWIQAYNSVREPYVVYDGKMVSEEIRGLYDAGLTGGYMTWNASSSLNKYQEIKEAFKKEY